MKKTAPSGISTTGLVASLGEHVRVHGIEAVINIAAVEQPAWFTPGGLSSVWSVDLADHLGDDCADLIETL